MSEDYCEKISLNDDMNQYLRGRFGMCRSAKLDKFNQRLYYNGNGLTVNCKDVPGVCTMKTVYGDTFVIQGGKRRKTKRNLKKRSLKKSRKSRKRV
jgi:hypothetical protein